MDENLLKTLLSDYIHSCTTFIHELVRSCHWENYFRKIQQNYNILRQGSRSSWNRLWIIDYWLSATNIGYGYWPMPIGYWPLAKLLLAMTIDYWPLAIGCRPWLLVIDRWLLAIDHGYWPLDIGNWLLAIGPWLNSTSYGYWPLVIGY
jgi:hypothetical protein